MFLNGIRWWWWSFYLILFFFIFIFKLLLAHIIDFDVCTCIYSWACSSHKEWIFFFLNFFSWINLLVCVMAYYYGHENGNFKWKQLILLYYNILMGCNLLFTHSKITNLPFKFVLSAFPAQQNTHFSLFLLFLRFCPLKFACCCFFVYSALTLLPLKP